LRKHLPELHGDMAERRCSIKISQNTASVPLYSTKV
jgi:hypothetical protein